MKLRPDPAYITDTNFVGYLIGRRGIELGHDPAYVTISIEVSLWKICLQKLCASNKMLKLQAHGNWSNFYVREQQYQGRLSR